MKSIDSYGEIENLIKESEIILVYFGSCGCNVCSAIKPKIEEMLKSYPKIKSIEVDTEKALQIAAAYNIFTVPGILVFASGKEIIREARYISIKDVNAKVSRYYEILFK